MTDMNRTIGARPDVNQPPPVRHDGRRAPVRQMLLSLSVGLLMMVVQPAASFGAGGSLTIAIEPVVTSIPGGGIQTVYALPNGEVITTTTPPATFDPLTATDAQLTEFGFPLPPSDAADLQEWTTAMAAYGSDDPPQEPLQVAVETAASVRYAVYGGWGGYTAGTWDTQSHKYVAVKAALHVPSNTGCGSTSGVGFWIGLGGTGGDYSPDNLVQQGIECGSTDLGSGSAYRPWTEFANTDLPVNFCGYSSWTLPVGDKIYQNMSFETSINQANFYLEDETTHVIHSCGVTPPPGWHWDLNTAEWEAEAPGPAFSPYDFDHVTFTDAHAQLNSNSSWVSLGSQTVTETIDGEGFVGGHLYQCIIPGSISNDVKFTDSWVSSQCLY